jgi:hypothetical protein
MALKVIISIVQVVKMNNTYFLKIPKIQRRIKKIKKQIIKRIKIKGH